MHTHRFILLLLFCPLLAVRADLAMEQQADDGKHIRQLSAKIHGDKMRLDVTKDTNAMSVIVDLDTRDSLTLMPATKTYLKRTGVELQRQAEQRRKAAGTNAPDLDAPAALAVATGQTEKINGRDTEIYTWSGGHKLEETLWVAKDFPNYQEIRSELAKLDRYNRAGAHRNGQPELSLLPGMVVRTEITVDGQKGTNTLVSANVGTLDTSLFELPPDYTLSKPEPKPGTKVLAP